MSILQFRLATVACLIIFLSGKISANFWLPVSLPSDPNDKYYQAFQKIPSPSVTATKLMTNFLRIRPNLPAKITRRQSPSLPIEDIVIVMDGSGSVPRCQFEIGKEALRNMMGLAQGRTDAKYAAVTFSSSATVNFMFKSYSVAATDITQIPYPGGSTNTQAGLTEAKNLFDNPSSGRRIMARKMVFLVTDGHSNVQQQLTIPKADVLKNSGVQIYVVAVGNYISGIDEMVRVASFPPESFLFRVKNLTGFWQIVRLVIQQVAPWRYQVLSGQNSPPC